MGMGGGGGGRGGALVFFFFFFSWGVGTELCKGLRLTWKSRVK